MQTADQTKSTRPDYAVVLSCRDEGPLSCSVPERRRRQRVQDGSLECHRGRPVRCDRPPDVQVGPPQGVLGPHRSALGLSGEKLLKLPLHERRIGECPIQHGLSEPTDRCLTSAIHCQASSDALPATLAGHTHIDECAVLPLLSEVDAGQTRCRDGRLIERQPRRPFCERSYCIAGKHPASMPQTAATNSREGTSSAAVRPRRQADGRHTVSRQSGQPGARSCR